jgi:hypothetical protein
MTELLLGGVLRPAGVTTSFLRAPFDRVVEHLVTWRRDRLRISLATTPTTFDQVIAALEPFESPWTREVLFDCGEWTAYLNNQRHGGDSSAAAPYLAVSMNVECFIATHAPKYGPGHAQTGLVILGPTGDPPLMGVRSIVAHAEDGRWSWHLHGTPQPFERPERYSARKIRDRFDRDLLLEYLAAVAIRADDPSFYGRGVGVYQNVNFSRVQRSATQVREELGW